MIQAWLLSAFVIGLFGLFGAKRTDPDEAVLAQIKKANSNLLKPHKIDFFLYFPTQSAAEQAALRLKESGFAVEVKPAAQGNDSLCFSVKTMVPELAALQQIRREFNSLVASNGGEYDGWGTAIVE